MNLRKIEKEYEKIQEQYNINNKVVLLADRMPFFTKNTVINKIIELGGTPVSKASGNVDIVVYMKTNSSLYERSMIFKKGYESSKHMLFVQGDDFLKNYIFLTVE